MSRVERASEPDPELQDLVSMLGYFKKEGGRYAPSGFWDSLNRLHVQDLLAGNYPFFKRTLAFQYFTWLPSPTNVQVRNLARIWMRHPGIAAIGPRLTCSPRQQFPPSVTRISGPRFRAPTPIYLMFYRLFVGLLRHYAEREDRIHLVERLEEPPEGGPLRMYWDRRLVSQDLYNSILELLAIDRSVHLDPNSSRVAELGAGYGRLAYVFLKSEMCKQYVIVDIPPALYVSQRYLSEVLPGLRFFRFRPFENFSEAAEEFKSSRVCFLTPDQLEHLPSKYFDLFISISSLQEMKMELVSRYISLIDKLTGGHCYLKQWREWRNPIDGVSIGYRDYPIPGSWRRMFARRHPVQSGMFEALWEVPRRGGERQELAASPA